jgi:peptide/nickel transport system permease protein
LAGYFSKLDNPLMRFTDMMLALPALPLLLVVIMLFRDSLRSAFGPETGIFILIVSIIAVLAWMPTARVVRGQVLSIKEKEFIEAAKNIGTPEYIILTRHILPNVLSPIIVSATLESALSFLGLGFPSDVPTWGRLLFDGKDFISFTPFVVIWPGLFISLTVLAINFIGDGLRDALDPKLRK